MGKEIFELIIVIPARYNSTRLPGKPLIDIDGIPMLLRVYQTAQRIKVADRIIVATEDQRINAFCKRNGIDCLMTSDEHDTMLSRIYEVYEKIKSKYYLVINGDEPLLESRNINEILSGLENEDWKSLIVRNLVSEVTLDNDETINNIADLKIALNNSNRFVYISRGIIPFSKSGLIKSYYKHLGCYLLTQSSLDFYNRTSRGPIEILEDIDLLRYLENFIEIKATIVSSESISIDVPEDVMKASLIFQNRIYKD